MKLYGFADRNLSQLKIKCSQNEFSFLLIATDRNKINLIIQRFRDLESIQV